MSDLKFRLLDSHISTNDIGYLYLHLSQRTQDESISHKEMPTYDDHYMFVKSMPYKFWYMIEKSAKVIGNFYMTHKKEFGIFIIPEYRNQGIGKLIVEDFLGHAPLFANINPKNTKSIKLFESLGFEHIQNTYRFNRPSETTSEPKS